MYPLLESAHKSHFGNLHTLLAATTTAKQIIAGTKYAPTTMRRPFVFSGYINDPAVVIEIFGRMQLLVPLNMRMVIVYFLYLGVVLRQIYVRHGRQ